VNDVGYLRLRSSRSQNDTGALEYFPRPSPLAPRVELRLPQHEYLAESNGLDHLISQECSSNLLLYTGDKKSFNQSDSLGQSRGGRSSFDVSDNSQSPMLSI
jgi:hypothetical protein